MAGALHISANAGHFKTNQPGGESNLANLSSFRSGFLCGGNFNFSCPSARVLRGLVVGFRCRNLIPR